MKTSSFLLVLTVGACCSSYASVSMTVNTSEPLEDVVVANRGNNSYTRAFSTVGIPTQGRGQTIHLPATTATWGVTGVTIRKNGTQTFSGPSTLSMWVFEWNPPSDGNNEGQWTTGDGISDGDPLDLTGMVTVNLPKTDFTLNGTLTAGDFIHFAFSSPLMLDGGTTYAIYFEYTQASGDPAHFQFSLPVNANSYDDGRLLTTTSAANGSNGGQDLTFYVLGRPVNDQVQLTIDSTEPAANVIVSNTGNTSYTRAFANDGSGFPVEGRGQPILMPSTPGTWSVDTITIRKNGDPGQVFSGEASLAMWVFEWNPADAGTDSSRWTIGDGISDRYPFDATGVWNVLLRRTHFPLSGTINDGDFLHFAFTDPLKFNGGRAYAIYFEYAKLNDGADPDWIQISQSGNYANGQLLRTLAASHDINGTQDLTFYVQGTAQPADVTLIIDTVEPATDIIVANTVDDSYTTAFADDTLGFPYAGRGQTVLMPATAASWELHSFTIKKDTAQTFSTPDTLSFWVYEWNPNTDGTVGTQWIAGDGMGDGDVTDGTGISNVLLSRTDFPLSGTVSGGDYLHFDFATPPELDGGRVYLFYFEIAGTGPDFRFKVSDPGTYADGALVRSLATYQEMYGQDLTFYVGGRRVSQGTTFVVK